MGILGRIGDSLESFALSIALRRKVGSVSATRASSVLQDLCSINSIGCGAQIQRIT
jgi:hypothetical protein